MDLILREKWPTETPYDKPYQELKRFLSERCVGKVTLKLSPKGYRRYGLVFRGGDPVYRHPRTLVRKLWRLTNLHIRESGFGNVMTSFMEVSGNVVNPRNEATYGVVVKPRCVEVVWVSEDLPKLNEIFILSKLYVQDEIDEIAELSSVQLVNLKLEREQFEKIYLYSDQDEEDYILYEKR